MHFERAGSDEPVLLAIDEFDAVIGTETERALARALDDLPPSLHVVTLSRHRPSFSLARLRLADALCEIGPDDLRFRSWEVDRLFRELYGRPLPPDEVAELERRTGGWVAALQLFNLATARLPALRAPRRHRPRRPARRAGLGLPRRERARRAVRRAAAVPARHRPVRADDRRAVRRPAPGQRQLAPPRRARAAAAGDVVDGGARQLPAPRGAAGPRRGDAPRGRGRRLRAQAVPPGGRGARAPRASSPRRCCRTAGARTGWP